jgi:hypothetical protein
LRGVPEGHFQRGWTDGIQAGPAFLALSSRLVAGCAGRYPSGGHFGNFSGPDGLSKAYAWKRRDGSAHHAAPSAEPDLDAPKLCGDSEDRCRGWVRGGRGRFADRRASPAEGDGVPVCGRGAAGGNGLCGRTAGSAGVCRPLLCAGRGWWHDRLCAGGGGLHVHPHAAQVERSRPQTRGVVREKAAKQHLGRPGVWSPFFIRAVLTVLLDDQSRGDK